LRPKGFSAETLTVHSVFRLIALSAAAALLTPLQAQEIPRPSMSRAAEGTPSLAKPYNLKVGPVALSAFAGLGVEFIDNLNLTNTDKASDIILRPTLGIQGVWQVTKLNNLELRTTLGYTKYLDHPDLDSQSTLISPDSEIRLNVYVGDVKIILHEQFALEEDPVASGAPSGVAKLGRFTNTIGVTALWDMNDVVWSLGYDHYNFITTGSTGSSDKSANSNLSALDHSTDQISTAVSLKLTPTAALGLEGTASYSKYPHNPDADSTAFSLGPYLDLQLTRYTHMTLGGGYQIYSSESSDGSGPPPEILDTSTVAGLSASQSGTTRTRGDGSGFYFNLSLVHRLNRFYQDRLSIGREFQVGILTELTETTYLRYTSSWMFSRRFALATSLTYEDVQQTSQAVGAAPLPDYRFLGAVLSTSYQVTKKMAVSLTYQYSRRFSDVVTQEYTQNRVALQFGYQF
jgi:hypothetical protein